ncbi:MAG: Sensor protein kinase WalK [Bacteroidetes bacterium ADurb.Bin408]|nr:MAG: Sensor protein kinase WalK [Bacteroidetes bacterium ADurb.Bin408]
MAIHAIAEAQKAGGIAAIIDAEHAFDPYYARKLGVNIEELLISQPDHGEQALEIADNLIRSGAVDIVVIDSVAALTPKAELEGDMGENKLGLQARLMSQALRKLTANISKTRTCCIFINQLREKIGVMFGNPETTTGGNALKFYSPERRPEIYIRAFHIRGYVCLSVRDNGLGIDLKKNGNKVFKLRKTFHNHPESKGFGLFITKTQVESMNGKISVKSTVNEGSTFTVKLYKTEKHEKN